MLRQISLSLNMTTCFHKYTPPEGQTQVIARAQSISLIRCLFRLVKCKFTEPLYKSAWYTLLSLLIFSTYALSKKREGHNLKKKKKKKGNIAVAAVVAFLCGYALKSAVLRYCGYRDSPSVFSGISVRKRLMSGATKPRESPVKIHTQKWAHMNIFIIH